MVVLFPVINTLLPRQAALISSLLFRLHDLMSDMFTCFCLTPSPCLNKLQWMKKKTTVVISLGGCCRTNKMNLFLRSDIVVTTSTTLSSTFHFLLPKKDQSQTWLIDIKNIWKQMEHIQNLLHDVLLLTKPPMIFRKIHFRNPTKQRKFSINSRAFLGSRCQAASSLDKLVDDNTTRVELWHYLKSFHPLEQQDFYLNWRIYKQATKSFRCRRRKFAWK